MPPLSCAQADVSWISQYCPSADGSCVTAFAPESDAKAIHVKRTMRGKYLIIRILANLPPRISTLPCLAYLVHASTADWERRISVATWRDRFCDRRIRPAS